jgi:hypothetical protein
MGDRGIRKRVVKELLASGAIALAAMVPVHSTAIAAQAQTPAATINLNIPAQDLGSALSEFARQSNQQLLYSPHLVRGKRSSAVSGAFAPAEGLRQLLGNSGVTYSTSSSGAFLLSNGPSQGNALAGAPNAGSEFASSSGDDAVSAGQAGVAEILVVGSRSQNVDI